MSLILAARKAYHEAEYQREQDNIKNEIRRKESLEISLREAFEKTFGIHAGLSSSAEIIWRCRWQSEDSYSPYLAYEGMLFWENGNRIELIWTYKGKGLNNTPVSGIEDLGKLICTWDDATDSKYVNYLLGKEHFKDENI